MAVSPIEVVIFSSPGEPPEQVHERSADSSHPDRALSEVTTSTLTISWPENHQPGDRRPGILICPGGGYARLAIDKEGHDIARWLNANGYVAAVLKYRLPRPEKAEDLPRPIEDGLAAVRLLRERAEEWSLRKEAIGILGSSAGGHLASMVATSSSVDGPKGNLASCRPDFQILLYPVISVKDPVNAHTGSRRLLLGPKPDEARLTAFSSDEQTSVHTPPAFLVHAADDTGVPIANSRNYRAALQKHAVPCELVELSSGGHGFGLGVRGGEPLKWPPLCLEWLGRQGFSAP